MFVAFAKYSLPLAAVFAASTAQAAVVISSDAAATSVRTSVLSLITADVATGVASGKTPGAYDVTNRLTGINSNVTLVGGLVTSTSDRLRAGAVTSRAMSNGIDYGTGTVSMVNASTVLGTNLFGILANTVLGLSADAITSTSTVSGASGTLVAGGNARLSNLAFTGSAFDGLNLDAGAYVDPAANTVLLSIAGLKVTLNEQIVTGNGTSALGMQTNAIRISLNDYLLGGALLSGDIILGHSEASISGFTPRPTMPVPEVTTWAMMIAGFGLIGTALRRRRPALGRAQGV